MLEAFKERAITQNTVETKLAFNIKANSLAKSRYQTAINQVAMEQVYLFGESNWILEKTINY